MYSRMYTENPIKIKFVSHITQTKRLTKIPRKERSLDLIIFNITAVPYLDRLWVD